MRAGALIVAVLLLGGCGLFRRAPTPELTPEQAACRAEAERAPALRALDVQRNPGQQIGQPGLQAAEQRIRAEVYRDCLRRSGVALPGGVEPLRTR